MSRPLVSRVASRFLSSNSIVKTSMLVPSHHSKLQGLPNGPLRRTSPSGVQNRSESGVFDGISLGKPGRIVAAGRVLLESRKTGRKEAVRFGLPSEPTGESGERHVWMGSWRAGVTRPEDRMRYGAPAGASCDATQCRRSTPGPARCSLGSGNPRRAEDRRRSRHMPHAHEYGILWPCVSGSMVSARRTRSSVDSRPRRVTPRV